MQVIAAALSQPGPSNAASLAASGQQATTSLLHGAQQAAQAFAEAAHSPNLSDSHQLAASQEVLRGLQRLKALLSECSSFTGEAAAAAALAAQQPSLGQLAVHVRQQSDMLFLVVCLAQSLMQLCSVGSQPAVAWRRGPGQFTLHH